MRGERRSVLAALAGRSLIAEVMQQIGLPAHCAAIGLSPGSSRTDDPTTRGPDDATGAPVQV